jgi:type III secretory pathway component EscV
MNEQTIRKLLKHTDLVAAVAVVVVVTMLIIPLPSMAARIR